MNPRAWCFVDNGPCQRVCYGKDCKRAADWIPTRPEQHEEPIEAMPAAYDPEFRLPHGFPIGVLIVLCTVALALALGFVIGYTVGKL